jgi:phytoene desaturase
MAHVVVIGAGLGGLSASIYARLAGHQVVVYEKGRVGGKAASIEQLGYKLDPGPSIIILTSIYRKVFLDAGRDISDYLRFQRLDPITRVFFGGDTFDIPSGLDQATDLVGQLSKRDRANFATLMDKLGSIEKHIHRTVFDHPFNQPWQLLSPGLIKTALPFDLQSTYKENVDQLFESQLLRAFFYGFPSYGGQSYRSKGPGALMIPYFMFSEGVWYPEGGVGAIPRAFEKLAREIGVEFRQRAIAGLETADQRVTGIRFADGSKETSFDVVISNRDRVSTMAWLGQQPPVTPSYSYFTSHWGVRTDLNHVLHHSLIVPKAYELGFESLYDRREFPQEPIVYLNNTSATDPNVAPTNSTNLFAVVTSPANEKHLDWKGKTDEYRRRVLDQMELAGIQFDPESIDFERIQTPLYFESEHENFMGSLYGADEQYRLFGLFPWRNYDEKFRNLLYVGGAVQPGAGLPMVTLSGKFAAARLKNSL